MKYDLIVIGGGPAGLSAALTARQHGAHVALVDENMELGGKLLGQLHEDKQNGWWIGQHIAKQLADDINSKGVDLFLGKEVWGVFPEWKVMLNDGEKLQSRHIVIATGAAEHANPLPGWTIPGVMAIGAAQTLNNYYRVKPGKKVAIVGVDPLSMTVAHELKMAGIDVVGIFLPFNNFFSQEKAKPKLVMRQLMGLAHLAPSRFLQLGKYFKNNSLIQSMTTKLFPKGGIKVWDIPLHLKKAVNFIHGDDAVTAIQTVDLTSSGEIIPKSEKKIDVDTVCISGRLYPLTELASALGCKFAHIKELGGHVPLHSEELETTIENVFIAGNITGIESAKVAIAQGELVGHVISNRLNLLKQKDKINEAKQQVIYERENALLHFQENVQFGREKQRHYWKEYVRLNNKKEAIR